MNVLLLMAGPSDNFREAGYLYPKPLIEIDGKPIIQRAIEQLGALLGEDGHLIAAVRHDESAKYHIGAVVKLLVPTAEILEVHGNTDGAACTALLAVDLICNDEPLIIVNGDQLIDADLVPVMHKFQKDSLDGGIIIFNDIHPRWSFVKCGKDGLVIEAAEKRPISNLATAGIYYFKSGRDFVEAAQAMILKNAAVNGSFYICPVYNEMILKNKKIGTHRIEREQYISLATPQGIELFAQKLNAKRKAK